MMVFSCLISRAGLAVFIYLMIGSLLGSVKVGGVDEITRESFEDGSFTIRDWSMINLVDTAED